VNKSIQITWTPQKVILVAVIILILFAVTTFGIVALLMRNQKALTEDETTPKGTGPKYSLEDFSVNLADQGSRRYLKATVTLELSTAKVAAELDKREAQIRDITITLLREQKATDLQAGSSTVIAGLKQKIKDSINQVLENGEIIAVYFPEFIVQ